MDTFDINEQNEHGYTPLMAMVLNDDSIDCTHILLQSGADATIKNNAGDTALHLCARTRCKEEVAIHMAIEIVTFGSCDVNIEDKYGQTALHHAVDSHRIDMAELLINMGANITHKDHKGVTPSDRAERLDVDLSIYTSIVDM